MTTELPGIVVVSHSRALADAAVDLARQMVHGVGPRIAVAAGLDQQTLGTDAVAVSEAIRSVDSAAGVVVLLDLGSAVLSAELALDLLDDDIRARVVLSAAPLVEGLVAAVVTAAGGATAAEVSAEAVAALAGKQAHLASNDVVPTLVADTSHPSIRGVFRVTNHNGLHARPAARLVAAVRTLDAQVELTNLTSGIGPVPAGSLSRVATLGAREGHEVEVAVRGSQATEALDQIVALAARNFDEDDSEAFVGEIHTGRGPMPAAPGIAVGPACHVVAASPEIPAHEPGTPDAHWRRLREAIAATRADIARTRARTSAEFGEAKAAIFDAHLMFLDDPDVVADARHAVDGGAGAARAWHGALAQVEDNFTRLEDEYLRERAADVRDVRDNVLRHLLGESVSRRPLRGIVVANDLSPADAAELAPESVQGVALAAGSPTSHAAILARAKGIPMVIGAGDSVLRAPEHTTIALDGFTGEVHIDPDQSTLDDFQARMAQWLQAQVEARSAARLPAVTRDGTTVPVYANIASIDDAKAAADWYADGVGLVRTEFLFHSRTDAPTRDEQEAVYRAIAEVFAGRRVVFRTLDAGGDKPIAFAPIPAEANPFLGVRGIRHSLQHKALLRDQLAALARVAQDVPIDVMFPMVSTVDELLEARAVLEEVCGGTVPDGMRIGIMVEVPATALKAAAFLDHVDFFSIGTNDLTQYALAADRGNPAVARLADPLDAGVLRLIREVCEQSSGRVSVSICGEVAADPGAIPVLLGLGVDSLSVAISAIATTKQAVRGALLVVSEAARGTAAG